MSYLTIKTEEGKYDILEKDTNQRITMGYDYDKTRKLCRKLNLGSGFSGFTPDFFASMKGIELDNV